MVKKEYEKKNSRLDPDVELHHSSSPKHQRPVLSTGTQPQKNSQIASTRADSLSFRPRIALYSPGMVGLGHTRRNLLIAQVLASSPLRPVILMIAEAREASSFNLPPGTDLLTLPALYKDGNEECKPRYLDLPVEEVSGLRRNTIQAALAAFKPDAFIVDHLPRGALQELNPSLAYLRSRRHTYCILGLRDVLDDPTITNHKWRDSRNEEAIRAYFDAVWVYGDPGVFDLKNQYGFSPDIRRKMQYLGYLDQRVRLQFAQEDKTDSLLDSLGLPPGQLLLCTLGGGQDGARLAEAFAFADLPAGMNGVILTGPFMPKKIRENLRRHTNQTSQKRVLDFIAEPVSLLRRADRVVGMGGYNTTCEVLSFEKPALIVPRVRPGQEQWIRAERLHALGLIDVLHPDQLNPDSLSSWLAQEINPPTGSRERIDLDGLSHLYWLVREALAAHPDPGRQFFH